MLTINEIRSLLSRISHTKLTGEKLDSEASKLLQSMDKKGVGYINIEDFSTEMKRRAEMIDPR